jgi:hypothetical protein
MLSTRLGDRRKAYNLCIFAIAASVISCGPSTRGADSANVVASAAIGPDGSPLAIACTPTGPELCFNAIDDNCNGVIDEGCGVSTGLLQFTIAWGDSPADVDLVVTDPAFAIVSAANRSSPSGLRLDRDCTGASNCNGQDIENIFFEGTEPVRGRYTADVKLVKLNGAPAPVAVRFAARIGSRTYGADVQLSPGDDKTSKKSFVFEL